MVWVYAILIGAFVAIVLLYLLVMAACRAAQRYDESLLEDFDGR